MSRSYKANLRKFSKSTTTHNVVEFIDPIAARKRKAAAHEKKMKTNRARARYELDCELPQPMAVGL